MSKDIIFESTQTNINEFIKSKDLIVLIGLFQYITTTEMLKRPPNDIEKAFIEEFCTNEGWADYVQERKRRETFPDSGIMFYRPSFDIDTITSILSYELLVRSKVALKLLTDKLMVKERTIQAVGELKGELEVGLDNAVIDGVFNKVEGFSNLYEILVDHYMVEKRED